MKPVYVISLLLAAAGIASCHVIPELKKIEGKYIVVLNDGIAQESVIGRVQHDIIGAYSSEPFTVLKRYSKALNGFVVEMSDTTATKVLNMPEVKYIEQDATGSIVVESTSWGLDRVDQRDLPLDDTFDIEGDGAGVTVYVLDTGIRTTHEEFGGRASNGGDYMNDGWNGTDCHGHGTHCAGTAAGGIHGIARAANVVGMRIFDCAGFGSVSITIQAIDDVIQMASLPAVMSMSFRFSATQALDDAIERAAEAGVVSVVAAGNENIDACVYSPARAPVAVTVGATDRTDQRAYFSCFGPCLDLYAPGVDIVSSHAASDTAIGIWSGTSMATPHVAGAMAVLLGRYPTTPPLEVVQMLLDMTTPNKIYDNEWDTVNRLLYLP